MLSNSFIIDEKPFGKDDWKQILTLAGEPGLSFSPIQHYPDETVMKVVGACCEHLKIEPDVALFEVGKFAAPELIRFAKNMLHPNWKTFQILFHLETLIHRTIRIGDPEARPADIQCYQIPDTEMQVVYSSRRGLCDLARGILTGMGSVFG